MITPASSLAPLRFVLMPFGKKTDAAGLAVDFDAVYGEVLKPAIADAVSSHCAPTSGWPG